MAARRNKDGKALSLFADVLREARHKAGLNSDELGDKLGYLAILRAHNFDLNRVDRALAIYGL